MLRRNYSLATAFLLGALGAAGCIKDVGVAQCPDGQWCSPGYECRDANADGVYECVIDTCGNGLEEAGEDCDDGAANSDTAPDACRMNCELPSCGDGVADSGYGEACDDGNNTDCDGCRGDCSAVETGCGDGFVCGDEVCDEGDTNDCDGCRGDCSAVETGCGDGFVCGDEVCDDGNDSQADDCPSGIPTSLGGCVPSSCGDGFVQTLGSVTEGCDDGNTFDDDDCPSGPLGQCAAPWSCGDGIEHATREFCDCGLDAGNIPANCTTINGNFDGADCSLDCSIPVCGDGVLNTAGGEECDSGAQRSDTIPDRCRMNCLLPSCGDGVQDTGEACDCGFDPANLPLNCTAINNDANPGPCRANCTRSLCGDGIVDPGEQCDDANAVDTDACKNNCTANVCGDAILNTGVEICDCGDGSVPLPGGCGGPNSDSDPNPCRLNCTNAQCGNGIREGTEQCDNGASNSDILPDACRTTCILARCGDRVTDSAESCDCGTDPANLPAGCTSINSNSTPNACRTTCALPSCGDGVHDPAYAEQCDNGALNSNVVANACRTTCTLPVCGDGVADSAYGEQCDQGVNNSNSIPNACRVDCMLAHCGDGVRDSGESCDDGNLIDNDACRNNCTLPGCGDGVVQAGEDCDSFGVDTTTCNANCNFAQCGDGYTNPAAGESCDTAGNSPTCDADCTLRVCGDGYVNSSVETCDPGAVGVNTPACDSDCTAPVCGDNHLNPAAGETCDPGAVGVNTASCDSDCTAPVCGDGHPNSAAGEQCDTAGQSATCNANCTLSVCGDGIVNAASGELCDPGAVGVNTAGCDSDCTLPVCGDGHFNPAAGEACDTAGNSLTCDSDCTTRVCGDGFVNPVAGETCDPGAVGVDTAACDSDCTAPVCGDNHLNSAAGEVCDPGAVGANTAGCDSDCTLPVCGDNHLNTNAGEICDPGAVGANTAGCDSDCTLPLCGDNHLNPNAGEICDPGAVGVNTPTCDSNCTLPLCGDALVNAPAGEACDPGAVGVNTAGCDSDCTLPVCGDNHLNPFAGELCDPGTVGLNTATCDSDCTFPACGDNHLNPAFGETCDDGETNSCTGTCNATCNGPVNTCGDGTVACGEQCDDSGESAACDSNCTFAVCGDSTVNITRGETCDDGDVSSCTGTCNATCNGPANTCGDGNVACGEQCDDGGESAACDLNCTLASCGDGTVNITRGETCDDGDVSSCTGTCNAACNGPANTCGDGNVACAEICDSAGIDTALCNGGTCTTPICGDSYTNAAFGETCDDGETNSCTGTCNATCSGPANTCGDGAVACGEQCDGLNLNGEDCASLVGAGATGTVVCTMPGCTFDTSGCTIPCTLHSECALGQQCIANACTEVGDTCNVANNPTIISGLGTFNYTGTTENLNDTYSFPSCGGNGDSTDGPDRVYQVTLAAGDYLIAKVTPTSNWDAALHVFVSCSSPSCRQSWHRADENNVTERIDYVASTAETVFLVVDGHTGTDWGTFDLQVTVGAGVQNPTAVGDVIFSEIMPEPAGGIDACEWIEIYNVIGIPLNLQGTLFTGCGGNFTVGQPLVLLPGERMVLAYNYRPSQNCGVNGVAWAYGSTNYLYYDSSCTISMSEGGTTFDTVVFWGNSANWPYNSFNVGQVGTSAYLCNTKHTAALNDEPRSWWVDTVSAYGSSTNYGTPGALNPALCDTWYNASWTRRKRIVIDNTQVVEDLTDFPVLVYLSSDAGLDDYAQGDGDDILFALPNGTKLSHEIQRFDASTGLLVAWVKLPAISATFDTVFFMYYGNGAAANQENVADVWSNGYAAVLHLGEAGNGTSNEYLDSTSFGHHGTGGGLSGAGNSARTPDQLTTGCMFGGYCQSVVGNNDDHIRLLPVTDQAWTAVTVQAWVYSIDTGHDLIFAKQWGDGDTEAVWSLGKDNDQRIRVRTDSANLAINSGSALPSNVWSHYSMTWAAGSPGPVRAYINGGGVITTASVNGANLYDNTIEPIIGNSVGLGREFTGRLQEIRLSNVARSAGWLLTEYRNHNSPGTFFYVSAEQTAF